MLECKRLYTKRIVLEKFFVLPEKSLNFFLPWEYEPWKRYLWWQVDEVLLGACIQKVERETHSSSKYLPSSKQNKAGLLPSWVSPSTTSGSWYYLSQQQPGPQCHRGLMNIFRAWFIPPIYLDSPFTPKHVVPDNYYWFFWPLKILWS